MKNYIKSVQIVFMMSVENLNVKLPDQVSIEIQAIWQYDDDDSSSQNSCTHLKIHKQ